MGVITVRFLKWLWGLDSYHSVFLPPAFVFSLLVPPPLSGDDFKLRIIADRWNKAYFSACCIDAVVKFMGYRPTAFSKRTLT